MILLLILQLTFSDTERAKIEYKYAEEGKPIVIYFDDIFRDGFE